MAGKLTVVGFGPGSKADMTLRAVDAIESADIVTGFTTYIKILQEFFPDKEFKSTGMTKEVDRCRMAVEEASKGKKVALVSSGDSGIYGMAALCYELRGEDKEPEIDVIPGLTAAASGASILGAPLTHDFAVISLSDRLTPWDKIEARLRAASSADMSIVLYNPVSKGRPDHLKKACDIMLKHKNAETVCGLVRNIGREGEECQVLSLGALRDTKVDMFTTVFIGNSQTKVCGGRMVTPRGYKHE